MFSVECYYAVRKLIAYLISLLLGSLHKGNFIL